MICYILYIIHYIFYVSYYLYQLNSKSKKIIYKKRYSEDLRHDIHMMNDVIPM